MKIPNARIEEFVRRVPDEVVGVLFYGPNGGLVREYATRVYKQWTAKEEDPFLNEVVDGEVLDRERAYLATAVGTISLLGGRRCVWVKGGCSSHGKVFQEVFRKGFSNCVLLVEAGVLPPSSSLRLCFEQQKCCASVACYEDSPIGVRRLVEQMLQEVMLSQEAKDYIVSVLGADREHSRTELEKIALYWQSTDCQRPLSLEIVAALVDDEGHRVIEAVVMGCYGGDVEGAYKALYQALEGRESTIRVVRALGRYGMELMMVKEGLMQEKSWVEIFATLGRGRHFLVQKRFEEHSQLWSYRDLQKILRAVFLADIASKEGKGNTSVCEQLVFLIGRQVRRLGKL